MKRWKNLRDSFIKAEKKRKASKASGSEALKQRKYIFNEELQFLRKICLERETEENFNDETNDVQEANGPPKTPEVTTEEVAAEEGASKKKGHKRQHKKLDEIDIKILEALQKEPEKETDKSKFFKSLLPHVEKFDDSQWLQYQMESLQLISKIQNAYHPTPHTFHTAPSTQIHQLHHPSNVFFPQPSSVPQMPQQAYPGNISSQSSSTPILPRQMTSSPVTHFQARSNVLQQTSFNAEQSSVIMYADVQSPSPSGASMSSTHTLDFSEW